MSGRKNCKNRYMSATEKPSGHLLVVQKPASDMEGSVAHKTEAHS